MKNNKVSLIKDIISSIKVNKSDEKYKIDRDERVVSEKNKIMTGGFDILTSIIVLFAILYDAFEFQITSSHIFMTIGIIYYSILIIFCKKAAVKDNDEIFSAFIWSFITLPMSINNLIMNFCIKKFDTILVIFIVPLIIILVVLILYIIANKVYKKSII